MKHSNVSPVAFIIPLVVAAVVIVVVMGAAMQNTEKRAKAGNDGQKACVSVCKQTGGTNCDATCTGILNGTTSCNQVTPPIFANWCRANGPAARTCKQKCQNVGAGFESSGPSECGIPTTPCQLAGTCPIPTCPPKNNAAPAVCTSVCQQVLAEGKTCTQVCSSARGDVGQCVSFCEKNFRTQ